jgi:hypothetical protein
MSSSPKVVHERSKNLFCEYSPHVRLLPQDIDAQLECQYSARPTMDESTRFKIYSSTTLPRCKLSLTTLYNLDLQNLVLTKIQSTCLSCWVLKVHNIHVMNRKWSRLLTCLRRCCQLFLNLSWDCWRSKFVFILTEKLQTFSFGSHFCQNF